MVEGPRLQHRRLVEKHLREETVAGGHDGHPPHIGGEHLPRGQMLRSPIIRLQFHLQGPATARMVALLLEAPDQVRPNGLKARPLARPEPVTHLQSTLPDRRISQGIRLDPRPVQAPLPPHRQGHPPQNPPHHPSHATPPRLGTGKGTGPGPLPGSLPTLPLRQRRRNLWGRRREG